MVLQKHLLTSLLTLSILVVLFPQFVMSFSRGSNPENILAAVAAYAAVLVVFVKS